MKPIVFAALILTMTTLSSHSQQHQHHNKANQYMHQHSFEELTRRFNDPARDAWQKPDQVIALLGDIEGTTIVDIGAGTGYFAFRLAEKGARVVAADVDDNFQNFIASKKEELNYSDDQVSLKKIPYDSPSLSTESANVVIIVNTYHHIENRISYFSEVLQGLVKGGVLVIVDFKNQPFDHQAPGPPLEMRISEQAVVEELKQSGFNEFIVDKELLDYQYIIRAFRSK